MAAEAEAEIILSDNDDDDCILEAVIFDSCSKKRNNNIIYDNIFKENALLAEVIEKCLQLENSDGMYRVINKTLLQIYKNADPNFKSSQDFEGVLKRTLIKLDKDPNHKFSHIKDLCELLRYGGKKKRAKLITLDNKVKRKAFQDLAQKRKSLLERRNKKQKTDVIDLDKYEEVPIINLDQMDTAELNTPIVIDDEKENQSSQENSDCCMEVCDELDDNIQNPNFKITNAIQGIVQQMEIQSQTTEVLSRNDQQSEIHIDKEIKEYREENNDRLVQSRENQNHYLDSTEKLLVPQTVLDLTDDNDSTKAKEENEKRIKELEKNIALYKEFIRVLDEKEVTEDSFNSPYVQSEKYKEKIVSLYKELCKLTGTETTKRREVRLKAMEGHPPGPVERLQRFLNRNIGEDGHPPFPDFTDVLKCVSLANEKDNLGWSKGQIMREASLLFTHCGRALQKRRQQREWSDLLARVRAEDCDDPADRDPALLARLDHNRRLAVKKEADLLERYTLMQLLPPERKTPVITTPSTVNDFIHDKGFDENDSAQSNAFEKNVIEPTKENLPNNRDNIIASQKSNNELTNTPNYLIQNGAFGMPKIIPESITNMTYSDEFGLPINDSKKVIISNGEYNNLNYSIENFVANVEINNINCNTAANNINVASLRIEDSNRKVNLVGHHSTINFDIINDAKEISNVEMNSDGLAENFGINSEKADVHCNETVNNTYVPRLKFEPSEDIINGSSAINFETNTSKPSSDSNIATVLNADVKCESNSVDESSIMACVKTEVVIKTDPTENIVKLLEEFGDNYTVSIFDFEDPFLVVEISDSSDDDEV